MNNEYYTIEKHNNCYTVWLNQEWYELNKWGSGGCLGLYTADTKKRCLEYCKQHKITITKI